MRIVVFEDAATGQLAPITTGRPAYAITCASYRLIDWLRELELPMVGCVRPHLRRLQEADEAIACLDQTYEGEALLLVNARVVPSEQSFTVLKQLIAGGTGCQVRDASGLLAAVLPAGWKPPRETEQAGPATPADDWAAPETSDPAGRCLAKLFAAATVAGSGAAGASLAAFAWPHDVVSWHMRLMPENMARRIRAGGLKQVQDGVFLAAGAKLGEHAVIDVSDGPIVLDQEVSVGPFCYLAGPVYAGPKTRVIEHAALKDGVSLGHTVKIGGEVEASVIEAYSNKQHHGFLGHSYLGSWINLGAGTCNSDLKNTYGTINVEYQSERVATGMQFMGCVMGDYSKTAINTGIFTGKVIGVASMLYGFVTSNVPSFVNYARLFGQMAEIPADVMINTQARMFQRRKVDQRELDRQLIRDMFALTAPERQQDEILPIS